MDKFAMAGIEWWNSVSESTRRYWLEFAQSSSPADAYRAYLEHGQEDRDIEVLMRLLRVR